MSQNKTSKINFVNNRYSINGNNGNRALNDYYLRIYGVSFSDIRATASQIQTAKKRLNKKYVSPLEISTYGTITKTRPGKIQSDLDKMPVRFLSYKLAKRNGEMFVVYRLSPEGAGLIGRFSDLHSDEGKDRFVVGSMRDRESQFNLASRRYFHPGNL